MVLLLPTFMYFIMKCSHGFFYNRLGVQHAFYLHLLVISFNICKESTIPRVSSLLYIIRGLLVLVVQFCEIKTLSIICFRHVTHSLCVLLIFLMEENSRMLKCNFFQVQNLWQPTTPGTESTHTKQVNHIQYLLIPKGLGVFFSKNSPNLPFLAQEAKMNFFSLFCTFNCRILP
jgi:hypothetical protein